MGLINDADNPTFNRLSAGLEDQPEPSIERPSSAALWGAAFRTENVVSSIMSREPGLLDNEIDDKFNPITDENLAGYENYSDRFYNVFNERQNAALKRQIDREQSDREIIARSGIAGFGAAMVAGTLDPTVLIPVGGTIKKGDSLLRVGRNMAYAGAAGAMVSEIALHASQETRTAEETGFAIAGGAVLGGILGAGAVAGFRGATGKPITGFDPDELAKFEREMIADPDGDLNAPNEVLLGQIEQDIASAGIYSPEVVRTQAAAMEAMVSTLARRTGQDPSEFYAANGPALRGDDRFQAGAFEPDEFDTIIDEVADDVWEGPKPKRPGTLIDWVRAQGGILDQNALYEGDVRQMLGGDARNRPGLLNNQSGTGIDELTRRANEEGFDIGPEDYDGFMRAIENEIAGEPTFRIGEGDDWRAYQEFRQKQANQVLEQASVAGYKGQDTGEAAEWVAAKNKGLDMSQEARMARAAEMGFDTETVLYHGTDADFEAFAPEGRARHRNAVPNATYLSNLPDVAEAFTYGKEGAQTLPLYVRGQLKRVSLDDPALESVADFAARAENEGFAGIQLDYGEGAGGAIETIIFDPSNIRSVNAAFDPEMSGSANLLHQNPPRSLFAAMKMDPQERSEWYDRIIDESRVGNNTVLTIKADTQNMIFDDVVIVIENGIDVEFTVQGQHADRGRNAPPENIAKGARVMAQATAALQEWMLRNDSPFVGFTGATEAHNRLYESMLGRFAFDGYLGYKTEEYRQYVNVGSDGSKQADGDAYVAGFGFMIVKDGYLEQAKHFLKSREDGLNVAPRPAGGGVVKNLGTTVPIERRSRRVGGSDQGGDGDGGRSGASGDGRAVSGSDVSLTPIEPAQRVLFQSAQTGVEIPDSNGLVAIRADALGFTTSAEKALFDPPPRFRDARNLTAVQWRKYFKEAGATKEAFDFMIEPALATLPKTGDIKKSDVIKAVRAQRPETNSYKNVGSTSIVSKADGVERILPIERDYGDYTSPGRWTNYRQELILMPEAAAGYKSHNWSQEGVVGHIRTTDRVTPDGESVRFVDELQSDLHQEGVQYGYQGEPSSRMADQTAYMKAQAAHRRAYDRLSDYMDAASEKAGRALGKKDMQDDPVALELYREESQTGERLNEIGNTTRENARQETFRPPRAPIKDWEKPFIRRVLQQAIEDGKDVVAFTNHKTINGALKNEGTQKFYDDRLPAHIRKVAKELGAKVERVGLDVRNVEDDLLDSLGEVAVLAIRITPEAKEKLAKGNVLFQGQRGQFDVDTNTISLFDNADPSTLMHEASHWYLDRLLKMRGNDFVEKQLGEILKWHGTKADEVFDDAGNLTSRGVELQEAFAETFESYLQTGKAPVPRLQAVFDQFREWLTALYKTLDPRERSNLTPEIKDAFDRMLAFEPDGMEKLNLEAMRNPQSVGAAAMAEPTLDDYELANSLGSADVSAAMRLNPLLRMATADSAVTREIGAQLMENGMYLKRNLDGMASPVSVEQAMTEYRGWHAKSETAAREAYKAARKDKSTPTMGETEFYERVALAMRRGDEDANPHVVKAAKAYREALDKVKDRAIAEGLLPEDVKVTTADSYFHRMWNRNVLTRRSTEFKQMTRAWLGDTFESMIARANQLRFELEKMGAKPSDADKAFLEQVDELEEILGTEGNLNDFAKTIADDVFDALMGHDTRLVDTGFTLVPNARGPLKERTFNIPDLFEAGGVKVEDFLVNDAQEVMSRYMRVMAADIELTRAFGSPDLAEPIARIREDYRKMSDAATTAKERKRLNDQMRNRIDDLNGVRDVIRGNYGENRVSGSGAVWARGAELVRAWNFMTMLGGMTVSALPDVGNKVMANGFYGVARDMIGPLMTDLKGVKGAAKEAKELGIAVEMALATRIASIADVGDMYGRGTKFERFVHNLSNRFSNWTLMRHWNDVMKTADYIAATNRAIRVMERPGRANKKAKAWLAQLGVGEADYQRIMAQIKEHGDKRHTMRLANVEKWTDEEAKRVWIAAMGKNANIQTVTPGAGDKLLVMNGDLGKTLGQFKSFAMAANQRVMIRGAQQARMGDARFLSGMMTFISLGMLVYALKSYFSNRETSDDPVTWVREGVDRSGTLPIFMEAFNTAEKVTGQSIIGDSPASRFASRGRVDSLAGPTFGRMQNVSDVLANAFDGELKDRDLHSVRKIMPFNNVFWLRKLFDEFEIQAVEALDAEETSLSERRESMLAN